MPHVYMTDQAVFWAVGDPVVAAGILDEPGVLLTGLALVSNVDANTFMGDVGIADGYNPLPTSGWLEAGDMYSYEDDIVIVRQSHNRTIYPPQETPALFMFYQEGAGVLDWIVGELVYVGTHRMYNDVEYICLQQHVTQVDWIPPAVIALWIMYAEPGQAWQAGVYYSVGVEVTYIGNTYTCLQAHTSQAGWEPNVAISLWHLEVPPSPNWQVGVAYKVGDHVLYGGHEWACSQAHTSISTWYPGAPGVYLWTQVS